MGDPSQQELKAPDAAAAAIQPALDERGRAGSDIDLGVESEKNHEKFESVRDAGADDGDDDDDDQNRPKAARLQTTRSTASAASAASATTIPSQAQKSRPWYKQVNPLRWGTPPPAPKERITSREYQAGFLSRLTFQWMSQLMTVSLLCPLITPQPRPADPKLSHIPLLTCERRDIDARWS